MVCLCQIIFFLRLFYLYISNIHFYLCKHQVLFDPTSYMKYWIVLISFLFFIHLTFASTTSFANSILFYSVLFFLTISSKLITSMMMMMNCFCGMVDRRKAFRLISSRDYCQRSSPTQISDTPRAGFEPAQSLSSDLVK